MTGVTPTRVGLAVTGASVLVAAGVLVGVAYTAPAVPEALRSPTAAATFPVGQTTFDDARPVRLAVVHGPETELTSPVDGRVTSFTCTPASPLTSGTSPLSVDGAPVVALATPTPLWRDLALGDRGEDVAGLQEELHRLGHDVTATGRLDRATLRAVGALRTSVGAAPTAMTAVASSAFLWLPAATTDVTTCSLSVGASVTAGDGVAVVPGRLTSIALLDAPTDLVPGARVLTLDGTDVALDPAAALTDPETLARLDALPSLRVRADDGEPVTARLALAEPVTVSVVPPSAVVGTDEQSCVVADGAPAPVEVVGSELGQSFVSFEGTVPDVVDVSPPAGTACA